MTPLTPLRHLAVRKAALTRHHGPDDPRTRAVATELKIAVVMAQIASWTEDERRQLAADLLATCGA